jgi:hypothetical protein
MGIYEELEQTLHTGGRDDVLGHLARELRDRKDYQALFYALLLGKRLELGLPAVQPGRSEEMPAAVQDRYEDAIRDCARTVGRLYLDEGNIPAAWPYYRMIGEPEPIKTALDQAVMDMETDRAQSYIEIALHEGVHPRKGFDLVIRRYGICSAITTLSQQLPIQPEERLECVRLLVRALHNELRERLAADIERREGKPPDEAGVRDLIVSRPWLFEDDFYHIDISHLGAIAQFALDLPPGEELELAVELCEYGTRISPKFRHQGTPPFEEHYPDYLVYLKALAGRETDEAVAHFRAKAERADPEQEGTYPAEVLVNLLLRLGREREAVAAYARYLAQADSRRLACPSLQELCTKIGDYRPLVEVSLRRGDLVNYVAGLLQSSPRPAKEPG